MKTLIATLFICLLNLNACSQKSANTLLFGQAIRNSLGTNEMELVKINPYDIRIEKEFLYDKYTLEDSYSYKKTTRAFQWDKIKEGLAMLETAEQTCNSWAILQNYKNENGRAPLVRNAEKNEYNSTVDAYGVRQSQSVPLYALADASVPERYGADGSLVKCIGDSAGFVKIAAMHLDGEWYVPEKYVKEIADTAAFNKTIFVDRTNQNIVTLEKSDSVWLVRSMNPVTTGLHKPPYKYETPLGIFVIQERIPQMKFYKDGTEIIEGYSPYASRFSDGAYLHGIPVNLPRTEMIEYSPVLGTTPRSHMCVRNATSHAKFLYTWAPVEKTVVFVID